MTLMGRVDNSMLDGSYERALHYLYSFHGVYPPRSRRPAIIKHLLSEIGTNSLFRFPQIFQITGTYGKGSTCSFLEALLRLCSKKTISLTSPHINSVRDRIKIEGRSISKTDFTRLLMAVAPVLDSVRGGDLQPMPMQIITLIAMMLHSEVGDSYYGIYEVGMGGLNDSTNVFEEAVVGLCTVAEDHVVECGGTFESVVREKLGICKPGSTLVYQSQRPETLNLLKLYCDANAIRSITLSERDYTLGLLACNCAEIKEPWQQHNAALAIALARERLGGVVDEAASAIKSLRLQCRFEYRHVRNRVFILDGAHNTPAVENLLSFVGNNPQNDAAKCAAIVGFSTSKEWSTMLKLVIKSSSFSEIVVTTATRPRGVSPASLAEFAKSQGRQVRSFASLKSALAWALKAPFETYYIFGSLLLAADFDKALHSLGLGEFATDLDEVDPQQPWMNPLI